MKVYNISFNTITVLFILLGVLITPVSALLAEERGVVAWGRDNHGQSTVPAGLKAVQIAAGIYHSLALTDDGTVIAWGQNDYGQSTVPAGLKAIQIACGSHHSLALTDDDTVIAWGQNDYGQSTVPAGLKAIQIACGSYHSLALYALPIQASFTHELAVDITLNKISFTDTSTTEHLQGHHITSWYWTFGDGTTSNEQNPTHTYGSHTDHQVTLIITDTLGRAATYTQIVVPSKPVPDSSFQWSLDTGYYTSMWFNRENDFINVEGLFSSILLPFTALIGSWFFMIVWGTIVMGMYLHTQDTTLPFVIGILLGAVISISAGAEGATVMYLTMAFAGGGVLAKLLLGRS